MLQEVESSVSQREASRDHPSEQRERTVYAPINVKPHLSQVGQWVGICDPNSSPAFATQVANVSHIVTG